MKEELVSFPTALLAKEKGFEENTECYYREDKSRNYAQYYDSTPNNKDLEWFSGNQKSKPVCTCPTQSFLQRWLREVYGFHITIHYHKTGKFNVSVEDSAENNYSVELFGEFFNTYEEALEAGLTVTLNSLIYKK